jgi:hypothetical protein
VRILVIAAVGGDVCTMAHLHIIEVDMLGFGSEHLNHVHTVPLVIIERRRSP